jgi:hypothetical protein
MELRTNLNAELTERFKVVKEHTGMKDDKNVLAFLISQAYDKIQETRCRRLFVDPATYERAEKKATAQGQTVDIFVQELIEEQISKAKET